MSLVDLSLARNTKYPIKYPGRGANFSILPVHEKLPIRKYGKLRRIRN